MNISVIISVWKRPVQLELILSELDSQAKDNSLHLEVIVSDSHSGKEIDDVVADNIHKKKNINIIHQHTKNILSAKRNFGASLAHGDYLIILDDDCIPASGYISSLLNYLKKMNSKSVLCGEVRFENELIETSNYYRYRNSLHPKFSDSHDISMNAWTFVAMNCVLDRKAFSSGIVSYNENFIGYGCEDHEFGWQLEKNDFKIIFADFKILHHEYSGDIEGYTKKIRATARDGMNVLSKVRPEMFSTNKKLFLVEKIFSKHKTFSKICQSIFFNKFIFKKIIQFLKKTDANKKLYFPILYRYVLISAYIHGIGERGTSKTDELLKNWYI